MGAVERQKPRQHFLNLLEFGSEFDENDEASLSPGPLKVNAVTVYSTLSFTYYTCIWHIKLTRGQYKLSHILMTTMTLQYSYESLLF